MQCYSQSFVPILLCKSTGWTVKSVPCALYTSGLWAGGDNAPGTLLTVQVVHILLGLIRGSLCTVGGNRVNSFCLHKVLYKCNLLL